MMGKDWQSKRIIDIETLDVFPSLAECARSLGVSAPWVHRSILMHYRVGGGNSFTKDNNSRLLEYFDYWLEAYSAKEKERYSRKHGVFFL